MRKDEGARRLLARNMKRLRELLGLSQMALAERVGCSTTLIGNIETLKRFPSAENLDRISEALEVPLSELFRPDSPLIARLSAQAELRARLEAGLRELVARAFEPGPGEPGA